MRHAQNRDAFANLKRKLIRNNWAVLSDLTKEHCETK